jgi:hypothetical protein
MFFQIFNHVCHPGWHTKLYPELDTAVLPPPGFTHRRLRGVTIRRAFHVAKDMPLG